MTAELEFKTFSTKTLHGGKIRYVRSPLGSKPGGSQPDMEKFGLDN
jgi:hypothetical protein